MPDRTFDPFSLECLRDPYRAYAWLRDSAPVYHIPSTDIWAVSRFADVQAVLHDPMVFSSTGGVGPQWRQHPMMSMYDPPKHTRLRRIVAKHFTPKYLAGLGPRMQETTTRLLAVMQRDGGGDFVADFAEPLMSSLIADLLGIPEHRRADFRRWSQPTVQVLATGLDAQAAAAAERTRVEFVTYLKQLIAERRTTAPPDGARPDIITLLLAANDDDGLTPSEVTAFCVLLLVAGFETAVNGLSNTAHLLLQHPDAWQSVRAEPPLIAGMIEEALRFDAPVQAFCRNTLVDAEVAGVRIPARQKVMVLFGSANRDPRQYRDAATFDLRRNPTDHLGFGSGVHYCIGAPLARIQYSIAWQVFASRVARMTAAAEPVTAQNALMRGFRSLPMTMSFA
jgi:cytochrome P450